jgi:hypothetical protein
MPDIDYSDAINQVVGDKKPPKKDDNVDYSDAIDGVVADGDIRASMNYAIKNNPESSARQYSLAKDTNLPFQTIRARENEIKQRTEFESLDFANLINQFPLTSKQLKDPAKASAIHDDIENLSYFERWTRDLKQSAQASVQNRDISDLGTKMFFGSDLSPVEQNSLNLIKQTERKDYDIGFVEGVPSATVEMSVPMFEAIKDAAGLSLGGAVVGAGVGSAVPGIGTATGATTGFARSFAPALTLQFMKQELGAAMVEFSDYADEQGKKLDPSIARGASLTVGIANGLLERTGAKAIAKAFPGGDKLFAQFSTESVKKLLRNQKAKDAFQKIGSAIISEGTTEAAQELINSVMGESAKFVANKISEQDFTAFQAGDGEVPTFIEYVAEAFDRAAEAGVRGAQGGAGFATTGVVIDRAVKSNIANQKFKQDQDSLSELVDKVKNSKVFKRNPKLFEEVTSETLGDQKLYVDASKFKEFFQSDESLNDFYAKVPEAKEQIEEALDLGGNLVLPANKVISAMAQNEQMSELQGLLKLNPETLTDEELSELYNDNILREYEESGQVAEELNKAAEIQRNIEDQITKAGLTPESARLYSTAFRAFYESQSQRSGEDGKQILQKAFDSLKIQAAQEEKRGIAQKYSKVDNLDLELDRIRKAMNKPSKKAQKPLLKLIQSRGGVISGSSLAGELESIGINDKNTKGLFKKQRGGLFEDGGNNLNEIDNIALSEFRDSFPNVEPTASEDGLYVDRDYLLELIREEQSGTDISQALSVDEKTQQDSDNQLIEELDKLGVDIYEASNAEIKAAIAEVENQTFSQPKSHDDHIRAESFKKWFGDSKVVDEKGEPLVVYHGSNTKFDTFDIKKVGSNATAEGYGFYLTNNKDIAKGYQNEGGSMVEAYLSMQKPLDSKQKPFNIKQTSSILNKIVDIEIEKFSDEITDYKDSFLSNFVDTYSLSKAQAIKEVAQSILEGSDTAVDQISELSNVVGDKTTVPQAVRDTLGFDGIKVKDFQEGEGDVYIAWFPTQIKSVENKGTFNPNDPNILYQFAGVSAKTADLFTLKTASQKLEAGEDAEEVRKKTGWFKGVDKHWRFEISDNEAKIKGLRNQGNAKYGIGMLFDLLEHDKLEAAYPQLAGVQVEITIDKLISEPHAFFRQGTPSDAEKFGRDPEITIVVKDKEQAIGYLMHEVQHAIQGQEGFASGGSPKKFYSEMREEISEIEKEISFLNEQLREKVGTGEYQDIMKRKLTLVDKVNIDPLDLIEKAQTKYRNLAGEIEARNTEVRRTFGDAQRKGFTVEGSQDVLDKDAIVVFDDGVAFSYQGQINKKGSIQFNAPDGETVISLFEGRDLSTLLHEGGHFFLEVQKQIVATDDAPEQIRADWQKTLEWLGSKDGNFTREQHEKFARGFEAYLYKGEAPSIELRSVFQRFKAWLARIYKDISNLNVKVSPEMKEVFDRMLATDEQIEALSSDPLFKPNLDILEVLTKAEQKDYIARNQKALNNSKDKLMRKTLRQLERRDKKWWKGQVEQLTKEAEERFNKSPIYRAVHFLKTGAFLDRETPPEVKPYKMDRNSIKSRFDPEIVKYLPSGIMGGKGVAPEIVAEEFGFTSADEMLFAMANMPNKKAEIKKSVDEEMFARHGDMLRDGSLEREALETMQDVQRASQIAFELDVIGRKIGGLKETKESYKQKAREVVGRKKVDEAIKPSQYYLAEVRAARAAGKALGQKDYEKAAKHKREQLLNHYLFKEATDARVGVSKALQKFAKYQKSQTRGKVKIDEDYRLKIVELLGNYRLSARPQQELRITREALSQWQADKENQDGADFVPPILSDKTHYRDMSFDEFVELHDTVENIAAQGRHLRSILVDGQRQELADIADKLSENINKNLPKKKQVLNTREGAANRKFQFENFFFSTIKARTFIRQMDGFKDLGLMHDYVMKPIDAAEVKKTRRLREVSEAMDDIIKQHYKNGISHKKVYIPELKDSISKESMIVTALNWGNEDNRIKLKQGRGFGDQQVEAILSYLDTNDWLFIEKTWDYIDSFWGEIAELEKRRTGIAPRKVQRSPFSITTKDRKTISLKGGYYPLRYDERLSSTVHNPLSETLSNLFKTFSRPQTRRGHTKERVANVDKPVRLDIAPLFDHLNAVVTDLTMGDVLENAFKILNKAKTRKAITDTLGINAFKQLDMWLKDLAIGGKLASAAFESGLDSLRAGVSISAMGFKASTTLIQLTGYSQTFVKLGYKYGLSGWAKFLGGGNPMQINRNAAAVLEKSKIMRDRSTTFHRDIHDALRLMQKKGKIRGSIAKAAFYPIVKMQMMVDMPTWLGAYEKGLNDFAGNDKKAVEFADVSVIQSQSSGYMKDLSGFERGTISEATRLSPFVRLFTVFYSYFNTKLNLAYEQTKKTDFKKPSDIAHLASDYLMLFWVEAVVGEFLLGRAPDFEDSEEDPLWWNIKLTLQNMAASLPVLREISSGLQGFSASPAGLRGLDAVSGAVKTAAKTAENLLNDEEIDINQVIRSLNGAGGIIFKYPSSQMNIALKALGDANSGEDVKPIDYFLYKKR